MAFKRESGAGSRRTRLVRPRTFDQFLQKSTLLLNRSDEGRGCFLRSFLLWMKVYQCYFRARTWSKDKFQVSLKIFQWHHFVVYTQIVSIISEYSLASCLAIACFCINGLGDRRKARSKIHLSLFFFFFASSCSRLRLIRWVKSLKLRVCVFLSKNICDSESGV